MNRTQKGALFTLAVSVLLLAFGIIIFIAAFTPGSRTTGTGLAKVWSWIIILFIVVSLFFMRRKQSLAEPDADERDSIIKKNALTIAFISLCILLFVAGVIPSMIAGDQGEIPVCLLPVINMGVFLVAMLVYSAAVLIQYGRGIKGEKT